jgi:hypothetical protein
VSDQLNQDQKIVQEGRSYTFKDAEVPLRDQVIQKLVKKLEDRNIGKQLTQIYQQANTHRQDFLERQEAMLAEYDEFLEPIYEPAQEWSSTLHLPIAFTIAKTYHARMLAALIGIEPPFTVKARQEANTDRAPLIQEFLAYTLKSWANYNHGVDEALDMWLWHWITRGVGILKVRWDKVYTRYVDVKKKQVPGDLAQVPNPETGEITIVRMPKDEEYEEEVTKEVFNGPVIECIPFEDVVIVGGQGDPQLADYVFHSSYMTASDLHQLVDQKVFRKEAVEEVINHGEDRQMSDAANSTKDTQAQAAGMAGTDKEFDLKRYQIIECNAKIDVDECGINTDVVIWFHRQTGTILRATYLRRIMPEGLRNLFKIDFHKRFGQDYGVGIIELVYSLTKEIDAIHNMKVDFGLLSTMPFGFYRPTSSLSEERLPYEPGTLLPLDNPQTDVYFPQLGNRTSFGMQEEEVLRAYIERLTSVSDLNLGVVGGQGATRTATGTRALLGESNANLDVYLRRMNRGWKRALTYLFHMLQIKTPPGFQFRILGDDGNLYWETIKSPEELAGMYDFELEGNSANSNKSIQLETAQQIFQLVSNPLDIQLGIVTPLERYSAMKNLMQCMGVKDFGRYIRKPQGVVRIFTPEEMANRVLAGTDTPWTPEQDLQGYIAYVDHILEHDELLGQFNEEQTIRVVKKQREAQAMLQSIQQQQAQAANAAQIQMNAGLSQAPTNTPMGTQGPPQVPTAPEGE